MENSRRNFIKKGSLIAGVGLTSSFIQPKKMNTNPNEIIRIGVIGLKGIGWANLQTHMKLKDAKVTALCDVDANVLNSRLGEFEKQYAYKPALFSDYRKLLESKDIDAVLINTPDHWHALQMIHACQAGKHVYVEKPLANTLEECFAMEKAAANAKVTVQVGQQQRSGQHWNDAIKFVHSGQLGKIRLVRAWAYIGGKGAIPKIADEPIPDGVDYDMWLGPAPLKPFNKNRFHFTFRWYWDYAGGLMTDWGVHMLDIALWGMKARGPLSVTATGGKFAFPDDDMETPDTLSALYQFNDNALIWEHTLGIGRGPFDKGHGVAFYGNDGTLVVNRQGWEVLPEINEGKQRTFRMAGVPFMQATGDDRLEHARNFLDCIKSGQKPVCDIETGSNVAVNAILGNLSHRTGRKILFDPNTRSILGDAAAAKLAKTNYRAPWKLPV